MNIDPDDQAIARRALDRQARARDFRYLDIPAYREWSRQRLAEGVSPALIAHMDATSMWLLPEEVSEVEVDVFEEFLEELRADVGDLQ